MLCCLSFFISCFVYCLLSFLLYLSFFLSFFCSFSLSVFLSFSLSVSLSSLLRSRADLVGVGKVCSSREVHFPCDSRQCPRSWQNAEKCDSGFGLSFVDEVWVSQNLLAVSNVDFYMWPKASKSRTQ